MKPELRQRQEVRPELRQELRATQQLIQNMEMLQVPIIELAQLISRELEQNPTLELRQDGGEPDEEPAPEPQEDRDAQDDGAEILEILEHEREFRRATSPRVSSDSIDDPEREEYILNLAPETVSLQQHLLGQIHAADVRDELRAVVEQIISQTDERGYIRLREEDVANILAPVYTSIQFDDLLALVREHPSKYVPEAIGRLLEKSRPQQPLEERVAFARAHPREALVEALAVLLSPLFPNRTIEELSALVREGVELIRSLEPRGVGAFDIADCFLLQLDPNDPDRARKEYLIRHHLDDILRNRRPEIAAAILASDDGRAVFGCEPNAMPGELLGEINRLIEEIARMSPAPGASFSAEPTPAVLPDLTVREVDGQYEIMLEESFLPSVTISREYMELLRDRNVDRATRAFLRSKLDAARRIIAAIEQRRWTLQRIAERIVEHQREFFEKGPEGLKPLTMTQLAKELGIDVSTVSRAVKDKYIQTPRGIFSLRAFFPQAAPAGNGASSAWSGQASAAPEATREQVLGWIAEIVASEDRTRPLSDKQIADRLEKEHGLRLKRRTIAKYREELGILSSRLRREYQPS